MPLSFRPDIIEGKVYRSKKKQDDDDEKDAIKELQTILSRRNRKSCDCEAQVHDLLENCQICGRLSCVEEGPGKCFSCGNLILEQNQRIKLAKYLDVQQYNQTSGSGRANNTSKGTIVDSQFDYFAIDNKKHLKEADKKMLKATLEDLQAKRHQRKLVFGVDIDNLEAGAQSAPLIDDYEAELRLLQLCDENGPTESSFSLAELIAKESKNNYNLEYIEVEEKSNKTKTNKKQQTRASDKQTNKTKPKPSQSSENKPMNKPLKQSKSDHTIKGDVSKKNAKKSSAWNKNNNRDKGLSK